MSKTPIKDLVVLITGTSRENGIGRALVEEAVKRGAKKVYATARDPSQLDSLSEKFQGKIFPLELDVTNLNQVQKVTELANDTQILINNAGTGEFSGYLYNYTEKIARREMEVNFFAPLHLINSFSKHLINNGNGAIVNIVSIGGLYPSPLHIAYSSSKAALYSLTQAIRIEMVMNSHSILVFGVYPGPIDTDMAQQINVKKESPANLALRVFDGMEQGVLDITTDALSDNFVSYFKKDPKIIEAIKKEFD